MQTNNASPESKESHDSTRNTLVHQRTWTDYLWIIREHWILGLILGLAAAGFFAYKQFQAVPLYKSVAILLFEPQKDQVINIQSVTDSDIGRAGEYVIRNHLTDIRSNSFRGRVVDSLTEEERDLITRDYADPESGEEPGVHRVISGANKVSLIGGNIFNFEFHHRNPEAAALLANRYSEEFIDFLLERQRRTNEAALRFLRSQSEELKLKVERSELAVQRYRQERNLVSLEESQNLIVERMKNLSSALNGAKVDLLNLSTTIEQVEEAGDDMDELARLPAINQMGTLPAKFEERTALLGQRKSLSLRYGSRHPRMLENTSALEGIEADIQASLEKNVSDLTEQHRQLQARVANLETALAEAEQESLELDQIAIEYNVLRRKLETDKRLFTQVHQRLNEAILASQLSDSNLRIVDRAWPAGEAFTPDTKKIYSMTVFLFLAVFVGVPFAIHYLNLRLKTAADIEEKLSIPFLGEIRKFPRTVKDLHGIVLRQSDEQGTELFRQLHSQILLKNKKAVPGQTYVVTSALPKEGKSFFAINIAASFSRHHYRTLLVDCDFRRPSVGNRLEKELKSDVLKDADPTRPVNLAENLDVLPFARSTGEATELIESETFRNAIRDFQQQYDIVIIDTPPAGLFPDAGLIGNSAHHFIFVTQLNKHRKAALKAILNRLDESRADILGMVVNKVSRGKSRNLGAYRYMDYTKYKNYYPAARKRKPTTA